MESSQLTWVDTHCHLYANDFDTDRVEMIERAIGNGVKKLLLPNIDPESLEPMNALAEKFPDHCYPMLGLHPCAVKENFGKILDDMVRLLEQQEYYGIGETGIDLYWDTTYKTKQIEAFELQIEWAKAYDLPVIIHSRESLDLNIEIIERNQDGRLRGIFHCFGGSAEQANRIEQLGFKLGIGGIVTFKNSTLPEVLPNLSHELFVLETDAPYLAPAPYRGKRNESSYLPLIAVRLAEIMDLSLEELAGITTSNARAVFTKMV